MPCVSELRCICGDTTSANTARRENGHSTLLSSLSTISMATRRMTRSAVSAIQRNNVELVARQPVGAPPKKKSKLLSGESFAQDSASVEGKSKHKVWLDSVSDVCPQVQQTVGQASVSGTGSVTVSHLAPKAKKGKAKGKAKANDEEHDRNQFLPRLDSPWKIGAHVSAAGGVENAVVNASSIGCVPNLYHSKLI